MLRLWYAGPLLLIASFAAAQTTPSHPTDHSQSNSSLPPGSATDPNGLEPIELAAAPPAFVPGQSDDTPPSAHPQGPVRISGGVMAGNKLTGNAPVYPPEARVAREPAMVVMAVTISKQGTVKDVSLVSGPPVFGASAMNAVRQWTYKPYLLNGQLTEVRTTVTVSVQLNSSAAAGPSQ